MLKNLQGASLVEWIVVVVVVIAVLGAAAITIVTTTQGKATDANGWITNNVVIP